MSASPVERLIELGFSEYEAKAYLGLIKRSPVSGYELSKLSGVPRSMIYEVMAKLTARGAAMTLPMGNTAKYAPVPAAEFLDQLQRDHQTLVGELKEDLAHLSDAPNLDLVWNIEGRDNVMAKAVEMIDQAEEQVYLAMRPETLPPLQSALVKAIQRGVRVIVYTTGPIDLPGSRIVVTQVSADTLSQARGLGLILVADGMEMLLGESLAGDEARASWTRSRLLVFIAEHHLRTDLYLPQMLAMLGDRALDIIREEDRDLFARAMESDIARQHRTD